MVRGFVKRKLLFIYNADSDPLSVAMDFGHKILSPATYDCRLCGLTYGYFSMKGEWKTFVSELPLPVEFLHKDEAVRKYLQLQGARFPSVFLMTDDEIQPFISAEEMNQLEDLSSLKRLVMEKLSKLPH